MSEAPIIVAEVFWRAMSSMSLIAGARRATEVLLRDGGDVLRNEARQSASASLQIAETLGVPPGRLTREAVEQHIFGHQSESLAAVVDASLLITMHALLDDALFQLLRVAMRATPDKCKHFVASKKIDLSAARDKSYPELLADKLVEYEGKTLERASLLEKVDHLLGVLRPEAGSLNTETNTFSRDRLKELDELRHNLVHGTGPRTLPTLKEDLDYLQYVLFTFWGAVSLSEPSLLVELVKGPPTRPAAEPADRADG